jgi:hypothetical protein
MEENIEVLPEQNTQILVEMHEVQVLHQTKIAGPPFSVGHGSISGSLLGDAKDLSR